MCLYIVIIMSSIFLSMTMPRVSHWRFQGKTNDTLVWKPENRPIGMAFIHIYSNDTVTMNGHTLDVHGHLFVHSYGLPVLKGNLSAEAHLITV